LTFLDPQIDRLQSSTGRSAVAHTRDYGLRLVQIRASRWVIFRCANIGGRHPSWRRARSLPRQGADRGRFPRCWAGCRGWPRRPPARPPWGGCATLPALPGQCALRAGLRYASRASRVVGPPRYIRSHRRRAVAAGCRRPPLVARGRLPPAAARCPRRPAAGCSRRCCRARRYVSAVTTRDDGALVSPFVMVEPHLRHLRAFAGLSHLHWSSSPPPRRPPPPRRRAGGGRRRSGRRRRRGGRVPGRFPPRLAGPPPPPPPLRRPGPLWARSGPTRHVAYEGGLSSRGCLRGAWVGRRLPWACHRTILLMVLVVVLTVPLAHNHRPRCSFLSSGPSRCLLVCRNLLEIAFSRTATAHRGCPRCPCHH